MRNKSLIQKIIQRDKFRSGLKYYKSLRGYHIRKDILNAIFRSIEFKFLSKNRRIIILDAGCGPGIVGDYVYEEMTKKHNLHPIIIFVDISEAMLEAVPKKFDYIIVKGDVTKLQFPDNFFDIVLMKQVLDYLPKNAQLKAIKEIYRVLKNNGQFILSAIVSPDDNSNTLTNYLYNQREKIIARGLKFKKYIPTKNILMDWLNCINFRWIELKYVYDIPLSTIDFQKSFGLNKKQLEKLNKIYCDIIKRDKNNYFKGKILKNL
jgi:SAM-dependent methyltransferase